jgi:hypothetical protein
MTVYPELRPWCNDAGRENEAFAEAATSAVTGAGQSKRVRFEGTHLLWGRREGDGPGAASSELVVALTSGRRIEVNRGFDGATLERLLAVLDKV